MHFKPFALMPRRAPYFCADRNRGKSRREPFRLGSRTLLNSQRGKLPFGYPYCAKLKQVLQYKFSIFPPKFKKAFVTVQIFVKR